MDILLLSTADWEHPFWTNKQHVAVELANSGHRVIYLDSLGLRKISVDKRDGNRIIRRLKRVFLSPRLVRPSLWIISPLIIPGFQKGIIFWINRMLLSGTLIYAYMKLGFKCDILWTYSPATSLYFNPSSFKDSIYHCVDDIGAQPNMPTLDLKKTEIKTAQEVNHIVVTTKTLKERLQPFCKSIHTMPNVVEYEHFANPSRRSIDSAKIIFDKIPKPIVGFVGAISNYKIDFELLLYAADQNPNYSFVLIGSIGEGDPRTDASELLKRKNIFFLGPKPYEEIPGLMSFFDIGILPSRKNKYTEAMFPMKFFEYLASGLPVTAIEIPSLIPYKSFIKLCKTPESFSNAIVQNISSCKDPKERRIRQNLARSNSYKARTERMLGLLNN